MVQTEGAGSDCWVHFGSMLSPLKLQRIPSDQFPFSVQPWTYTQLLLDHCDTEENVKIVNEVLQPPFPLTLDQPQR